MEEQKQELIVLNDIGKPALSDYVADMLEAIDERSTEINDLRNYFNQELMDAMLAHNLKKAKVGKFNVSIRENKSKWVFNTEAFLKNESKELIDAFTKTETQTTEQFDIEGLKAEYPDIYAKFLHRTTTEVKSIDENALWKNLNSVWSKYATEIMPEKVGTISIKKEEE